MPLALKMEMGSQAKEHRQPLEAGKGQEMHAPQEPPERTSSAKILALTR